MAAPRGLDAEARSARRIATLQRQIQSLQDQVQTTESKIHETKAEMKSPETADETVRRHIRLLHQYNEIRDVGMGLMGLIAERRGVRVRDVYAEFGVSTDD